MLSILVKVCYDKDDGRRALLRSYRRSATLRSHSTSFRSGRITRDMRFSPRLGLHPNFAPFHSAKLRISQTLCKISLRSILPNARRLRLQLSEAKLRTTVGYTKLALKNFVFIASFRYNRRALGEILFNNYFFKYKKHNE